MGHSNSASGQVRDEAAKQAAKSETTPASKQRRKGSDAKPSPNDRALIDSSLIVVGIGASAGGLEALRNMLAQCKPDPRIAYVVAQHMSPERESMLQEILQPRTELTIAFSADSQALKGGRVYIIPPGMDAKFDRGHLLLVASGGGDGSIGPRPSVNRPFESMAREFGNRCVGVILSGTGSDGSKGLEAIRDAGGVRIVQDPETAQYAGMPQSAISTGTAESVISPERIGPLLGELTSRGEELEHPVSEESVPQEVISRISQQMNRTVQMDLDLYKRSTVLRRVDRRMNELRIKTIDSYADHLANDPNEARMLAKELSIGVTSFFRDPTAFDGLRQHLIKLVNSLPSDQVFRAWVPACSTGEEAYSLAILLAEVFAQLKRQPNWSIFATDVNEVSINHARLGAYPVESLNLIPAELRNKYLDVEDDRCVVQKHLRREMVFARHNILSDPPFSRLHCITCRNLLIYLKPSAQRHVLSMLHYSLVPGGLLMLGQAESTDAYRELFEPADQRARIYERTARAATVRFPGRPVSVDTLPDRKTQEPIGDSSRSAPLPRRQVEQDTRSILCDQYAPPTIVVDRDDHIIHFVGDLAPFVNLPRGPADWLVADLVRAPMNVEVRTLLHRARRNEGPSQGDRYTFEVNGTNRWVRPVAFRSASSGVELVMLAFEVSDIPKTDAAGSTEGAGGQPVVDELQRELADTREHLQSVIEEVETSNEELQTLNEELQSSNEELQSTNEELQTSNEELQSANEELSNVNEELADKTLELDRARTDLVNVKDSMTIGLLVLDANLAATEFNQKLQEHLEDPDSIYAGCNVAGLRWAYPLQGLVDNCLRILDDEAPFDTVVSPKDGLYLRLSFAPFLRATRVEGVVITLEDVSQDKLHEAALKQSESLFRVMFESAASGMLRLDTQERIQQANAVVGELLEITTTDLVDVKLSRYVHPEDLPLYRATLQSLLRGSEPHGQFEARLSAQGQHWNWCNFSAAATLGPDDQITGLVMQIQDISLRRNRQQKLINEYTQLRVLHALMRRVASRTDTEKLLELVLADLSVVFPEHRISILQRESPSSFGVSHCQTPKHWRSTKGRSVDFSGGGRYIRELMQHQILRIEAADDTRVPIAMQKDMQDQGVGSWLDVVTLSGERIHGILRVESREGVQWTDADTDLLQGVADVLSIAERDRIASQRTEHGFEILTGRMSRLEQSLDQLNPALLATDADGQIEFINQSARTLLQVEPAQAVGKAFFKLVDFCGERVDDRLPHPLQECLQHGTTADIPDNAHLIVRNDQGPAVSGHALPLTNQAGTLHGALLVMQAVHQQSETYSS